MIHLNLIDAAERLTVAETVAPVHVTNVDDLQKNSRKKVLTVLVSFLFLFVVFSCFLSLAGVPASLQGLLPAPYLSLIGAEDPSRSALAIAEGQRTSAGGSLEAQAVAVETIRRERESITVKQVVGEINPQVLFNNKRTEYSSFLPLEKQSYQKAAVGQFIAFLNTTTPDNIGFSDCIFQAPNFYYLRGVAGKPESQKVFLERVSAVSTDFKTPPLPENAPATDITAFGKYNVTNVNLGAVSSFVRSSEVAAEIKALKTLAGANKVQLSGLDKPIIEDFGVYRRYTYKVVSSADFSELQAFLVAFSSSPVRLGVQSIELKQAKRDMISTTRFEMYVVK